MYSICLMYFLNSIRFCQTKVLIEIISKASWKSDINEIVFTQNHPNGQTMMTKCEIVEITHFFRFHIKQYSHFQRVTTKQEQTHF